MLLSMDNIFVYISASCNLRKLFEKPAYTRPSKRVLMSPCHSFTNTPFAYLVREILSYIHNLILSRTRYKIYLSNFDDDIRSEVVETSVITTDNSPSQEHPRPDHKTTRWHANPGFKPFTSCVITKII